MFDLITSLPTIPFLHAWCFVLPTYLLPLYLHHCLPSPLSMPSHWFLPCPKPYLYAFSLYFAFPHLPHTPCVPISPNCPATTAIALGTHMGGGGCRTITLPSFTTHREPARSVMFYLPSSLPLPLFAGGTRGKRGRVWCCLCLVPPLLQETCFPSLPWPSAWRTPALAQAPPHLVPFVPGLQCWHPRCRCYLPSHAFLQNLTHASFGDTLYPTWSPPARCLQHPPCPCLQCVPSTCRGIAAMRLHMPVQCLVTSNNLAAMHMPVCAVDLLFPPPLPALACHLPVGWILLPCACPHLTPCGGLVGPPPTCPAQP